ncbi:PREDICTED: uncharacterized protein LOC106912504 isoform X1 [Poecilia mexicana]|uniref:uncharacterized protein LOC106912504 isoform X1 n=1 Tax=Poecilia mexicana TaxID=48701 RepID=UPI00072EE47C|nr:PREDICTED: uncharacterized protein LOC106912504 isoform X1 [Poecilia mexicana]
MYLLQALMRWNQDQTRVAAGEGSTMGMNSTELKKQKLNQLRQHLLGETLPETTKPLLYTGELMGINYLYSQTGRKLRGFPDDPEEPDCSEIKLPDEVMSEEDWPLNVLHKDVDEGFDEVTEACFNPLLKPSLLQQSSAPQKPPVSDSQLEPVQEAPGLQEEAVGPDVAPGYQHVVRLAHRLITFARKGYITNVEVKEIIHLWMNLSEDDKRPVACPSKEKDSPTRGRGRRPAASCVTGTDGTMSLLPDASRLVEAIFKELSILHPTLQRIMGVVIYRWSLVLRHYNSIRNVVMSHPTLRSRTTLNLFAINQVTAAQWHKRFMPRDKMTTPVVAVAPLEVTVTSVESSPVGQEPQMDSSIFSVNQNLLVSAKDPEVAPSHTSPAPSTSISMVGDAEVPDFTTHTPQSTASKKKAHLPEVEVAAKWGQMLKVKSVCINFCRSCGDRKIKETGHRILRIADGKRLNYCPRAAKGKSPEEWLASLRL